MFARYLRQLHDVFLAGVEPEDGAALVYDRTLHKWVSGTNGNSGSSSAPLYVRLSIRGGQLGDSGADVPSPISGVFGTPANVDGMAYTGPTLLQAGRIASFWVTPPVLPDGSTLFLSYAEFRLSNADATEALRLEYDGAPIPITTPLTSYYLPFADCSVAGSVGSDLALVSHTDGGVPDTAGIQTTAGGAYFQELLIQFVYTPPT